MESHMRIGDSGSTEMLWAEPWLRVDRMIRRDFKAANGAITAVMSHYSQEMAKPKPKTRWSAYSESAPATWPGW